MFGYSPHIRPFTLNNRNTHISPKQPKTKLQLNEIVQHRLEVSSVQLNSCSTYQIMTMYCFVDFPPKNAQRLCSIEIKRIWNNNWTFTYSLSAEIPLQADNWWLRCSISHSVLSLSIGNPNSSFQEAHTISPNRKLVAAALEVFGCCTIKLKIEVLCKDGNDWLISAHAGLVVDLEVRNKHKPRDHRKNQDLLHS